MFRTENRWMNLLSWLHAVLLFSGFYLAAAGIFSLEEKMAVRIWLESAWLFIPVITSWFFIRKIGSFWGYLLGSLAVTAIITVLSKNILTFVFSVLIFVIRAYVRVIRGRMNDQDLPGEVKEVELWEIPTILDIPRVYHWVIFVVLYFVIILLEQIHLLKWMFVLLFIEIFVTYIYGSLNQMTSYVVDNCHIAHLPVKAMQRMQKAVLGITLVMLVLLVLPSVFYGKEPLAALTRLDFDWEFNLDEEMMQTMPETGDPGEAMRDMFGIEKQEPNVVLNAILDGIIYVLMALVSLGIIGAVWHMCRNLMNSFEKGKDADEIISLDDEGESLVTRIRRTRTSSDRRTADYKIRKAYKKMIRKKLKGKPAGWETPEELEEKAGLETNEDSKVLHEVYEKARYSLRECNEDDLRIFTDFLKSK